MAYYEVTYNKDRWPSGKPKPGRRGQTKMGMTKRGAEEHARDMNYYNKGVNARVVKTG